MQKEIEKILSQYCDPYLGKDLITLKALQHLSISDSKVDIEITLPYPFNNMKKKIIEVLNKLLAPVLRGKSLNIKLTAKIDAHVGKLGIQGLPNIKNMIAVASGKGGVGKSTIAVNLALALAQEGAKVGLLDADIYGPSQPAMLGTMNMRPILKERILQPIDSHSIQSMSIGYLIDETSPMIWRGPMIGKAMQQLLYDTKWDALDYLILDLPPGTGDIQLTLCQKIPLSGALIVTTPQDLALLDVKRACEMFNKLGVPLLGIVENMSHYHCPQCGHKEHLFGAGGADKLAKRYNAAVLANIPLDIRIREMTDGGTPPVVAEPQSAYAQMFYELAHKVGAALAQQAKDYSAKFPKILVAKE